MKAENHTPAKFISVTSPLAIIHEKSVLRRASIADSFLAGHGRAWAEYEKIFPALHQLKVRRGYR
jgi:hypothetical protein